MAEVPLKKNEETEGTVTTVLSEKERKIFVIIFAALAVIAVIGGFFLWQKNLNYSFLLNQKQLADLVKQTDLVQNTNSQITPATPANTGATWDPNLNCPSGQVCGTVPLFEPTSTASSDNPADVLGQSPDLWNSLVQNSGQDKSGIVVTSSPAAALQLGTLSPAQLRQVLKQAGATDADLNKLTDAQLQAAWQDFVNKQQQK